MTDPGRDRLLGSLLWAAVAACGQFTALFFAVIARIHVSFANGAPVFSVDPRGPIVLTKNSALQTVWILTVLFSAAVFWVLHRRPRPSERACTVAGVLSLAIAGAAGLAEPWWMVTLLVDAAILAVVVVLAKHA